MASDPETCQSESTSERMELTTDAQFRSRQYDTFPPDDGKSKSGSSIKIEPLSVREMFTIASMFLSVFCNTTSMSVLTPFMAVTAAEKGVSVTVAGFIMGVFYLTLFLTAPFVSYLIPRVGLRAMTVMGSLSTGIFGIIFGVLEYIPNSMAFAAMCFVCRILQATASNCVVIANFSAIALRFPERTFSLFGATETFAGIGFMLGPFVGGALYGVGGFGLPFYVVGSLLILSSLISFIVLRNVIDEAAKASHSSWIKLLRNFDIAVILYTASVNYLYQTFLEATLALHLKQFNLTWTEIGSLYLLWAILYALTAPIWGKIGEKYGFLLTMMLSGTILSLLALNLLGPAPFLYIGKRLWVVIIGLVAIGVAAALTYVAPMAALLITTLNKGCPDNLETYAIVSGMFSASYSLGGFTGSCISGVMFDHLGFPYACSVISSLALLGVVGLIVFAILKRRPNSDVIVRGHDYDVLTRANEPETDAESSDVPLACE